MVKVQVGAVADGESRTLLKTIRVFMRPIVTRRLDARTDAIGG
jgi:hypothetical protein